MKTLDALSNLCLTVLALVVLALIVLDATNNILVQITVAKASLFAPGNGTTSVAYNLSFAVRLAAPLDAELRLGGRPFAHVRLAGAEPEQRIRPMRRKVYRVAVAAPKSVPMVHGGDADMVAAFRLALIVYGKFKYEPRIGGGISTTVRCPLRLPLSSAPAAGAFTRFERARPQRCTETDVSIQ